MSSGQQPEGGAQEQPADNKAAQDFAVMISSLLQQMQGRFEQMSDTILSKIDEMDKRLDDLEGTMHTLASQSGVSLPPPSQTTPPAAAIQQGQQDPRS